MSKRYVIYPDIQVPYEDRKALAAMHRFVGEYQPDEVVFIGDIVDFPTPSRWSKGTAAEFEGSVFEDAAYAKKKVFDPLREVYDGPVKVLPSNHDERPAKYLKQYAPALAESCAFDIDVLLDFAGYDVEMLPLFYHFAPGWLMTHGHAGGIRLTQEAGRTALNAAVNKFHKSVVCGHSHRLGQIHKSFGFPDKIVTYTGVEVGNIMSMELAQYLKGGPANWQQGFAIAYVDGKHVTVNTIPIVDKRFTVEGQVYKL